EQVSILGPDNIESHSDITSNISDEEILETIKKLDRELGTENYLPIFHLRQKLQPPLLRDDLDQALYRLQKSDKIELRGLVDAQLYTHEQVNAGISQRSGSPLFFIQLTEN
ncbi:MAG: transcription factor RcaD, partial [Dolichospermum sp.]